MSSTNDDRLQIRVNPEEKHLLERAAALSHVSVSTFVVRSAAQQATELLADRPLIELGPDATTAPSARRRSVRRGGRSR